MPKVKPTRPRTTQACNSCRSKKYKCDGCLPCSHCRKKARECIFQGSSSSASRTDVYTIDYVIELERKLDQAEALLRLKGSQETTTEHEQMEEKLSELRKRSLSAIDQSDTLERHDEDQEILATNVHEVAGADISTGQIRANRNEDGDIMDDDTDEIMDINNSTHRFEFHGETSSLAFLERLRKVHEKNGDQTRGFPLPQSTAISQIVSEFQDDSLTGQRRRLSNEDGSFEEYFPLYAMVFIENYFKALHFAHPILDQQVFLERCHRLWSGTAPQPSQAFKALYFSVLSLGALTRAWTEDTISSLGRYEWTRLLFEKAEQFLGAPGTLNNLEAAQTQFLLAVVCQHLLNPNLAYTYLGIAIRTTLSTGMNRLIGFQDPTFPSDSPSLVVSRIWWAVYSLEIELSFTLGRPDTLGLDAYHNRPPPPITNTEISIIPAMLGLSRIKRNISTGIFLDRIGLSTKFQRAEQIERDLENWVSQLPLDFQSISSSNVPGHVGSLHDPSWLKLQKLVLRIKYLHVKTILFYPFLMREQKLPAGQQSSPSLASASQKCRDGAMNIIETIHSAYYVHEFFRTWWYNVTYITFGISILLAVIEKEPPTSRPSSKYIQSSNQGLDLLGAMSECTVAGKIRNFAREFVNGLLKENTIPPLANDKNSDGMQQNAPLVDFNSSLTDFVGNFGYDVSAFDAGLDDFFQDGDAWGLSEI